MDAQQEFFSELREQLKVLGYDVYDGVLPPESTPYPFVYLAESTSSDISLKNALMGSISQTIDVWHNNPQKRGTVSTMLAHIKAVCREIDATDNYKFYVSSINQTIGVDDTTEQTLLRGMLTVELTYC